MSIKTSVLREKELQEQGDKYFVTIGARFCTKRELEENCSTDTGCECNMLSLYKTSLLEHKDILLEIKVIQHI